MASWKKYTPAREITRSEMAVPCVQVNTRHTMIANERLTSGFATPNAVPNVIPTAPSQRAVRRPRKGMLEMGWAIVGDQIAEMGREMRVAGTKRNMMMRTKNHAQRD